MKEAFRSAAIAAVAEWSAPWVAVAPCAGMEPLALDRLWPFASKDISLNRTEPSGSKSCLTPNPSFESNWELDTSPLFAIGVAASSAAFVLGLGPLDSTPDWAVAAPERLVPDYKVCLCPSALRFTGDEFTETAADGISDDSIVLPDAETSETAFCAFTGVGIERPS